MLIYFIALLAAASVVLVNNLKVEAYRWAAYFLASASIGGLSYLLAERGWDLWAAILAFVNYTVTPYAVLVFSLLYTLPTPAAITKRRLKLWLLLPVLFMAGVALLQSDKHLYDVVALLWFAPYYLLSCALLIRSVWLEKDRGQRRGRLITAAIIAPTLVGVLVFIYGAKAFVPDFAFMNYVSVFIAYSLVIAGLSAFVYGVLGVKLTFEPDPLGSRRKAISTGVAMLNHSFKNEIGKIAISAENVNAMMAQEDQAAAEQLLVIKNASRHMLGMVARMHSQLKDILLREQELELDRLVGQCLSQHREALKRKQIAVSEIYVVKPLLMGDPVHLLEAFGNVVMNAVEAMPETGGSLEISIEDYKRGVRLAFADNGPGVPDSLLDHVFEPFVSGGKSGLNFGLGLSYVSQVMQLSGGKVELANRSGGGACVSFYWPRRKLAGRARGRER